MELRQDSRTQLVTTDQCNRLPKKETVHTSDAKGPKEYLHIFCFQNAKSSFTLVVIVFVIKVTMCLLYAVRATLDDLDQCTYCGNSSILGPNEINWHAMLWIQRPLPIWAFEVAISLFTALRMVIVTYVRYKGNIRNSITLNLTLEMFNSLPFIATLCWPPLQNVFIPSFLNCWMAMRMLHQNILSHNVLRASCSHFTQELITVIAILLCLFFTGACGIQHLQRSSANNCNLFESFYFIIVTLSTVGYGDISPDIWPSRLFVITMVLVTIIMLPKQCESLAGALSEREKLGGSYGKSGTSEAKHVVCCGPELTDQIINDFLGEFYSHRHLQDHYVVFMSANDPPASVMRILRSPLFLHRVKFIRGSCISDDDLRRTAIKSAKACFVLAEDSVRDKNVADQHTVLRAWAIKDYAPNVRQYVQIFRPENRIHVKFAEFAVCVEEFKYSILAYNCLIPGTSTLITLLLHTSKGEEGQSCEEEWLKLYGRGSGNEIYSVRLEDSKMFAACQGNSFTEAANKIHTRYGAILIGIQSDQSTESIRLNPGSSYKLCHTDILLYMNIRQEKDMDFSDTSEESGRRSPHGRVHPRSTPTLGYCFKPRPGLSRQNSFIDANTKQEDQNSIITRITVAPQPVSVRPAFERGVDLNDTVWHGNGKDKKEELIIGYPPTPPYIGTPKMVCHLLKNKKPICCLHMDEECDHNLSGRMQKVQHQWAKHAIILAAEMATNALYSFILPLRAYFHAQKSLKPIVLLLENEPEAQFLEVISHFPFIYIQLGSISHLDDLLSAGINYADNVVVVNGQAQGPTHATEDLMDSSTIVSVQTLLKYFPHVSVTAELSQSSNMRFMQFQPNNSYSQFLAQVENSERKRGSTIPFMFRSQFASGRVFSSNMVDTLLYQGFMKEYVIPVIRRLVGILQPIGSGFLTSVMVSKGKTWTKTYGTMFQHLIKLTEDIPIALYRTQCSPNPEFVMDVATGKPSVDTNDDAAQEIPKLVKSKMELLGLRAEDYEYLPELGNKISFVIINPDCDLELQDGDILFVIRPSSADVEKCPAD